MLRDLATRGATGRLRLAGPDGDTLVWLREGRVHLASQPGGGLDLAARLRSSGAHAPALAEAAPLGWDGLAELGPAGRAALEQAAREQTLDALSAALSAHEHDFTDGELLDPAPGPGLTVEELLEACAARQQELERLRPRLPGPGAVPRLADRPGQPLGAEPAAWAVLGMVDGRRSLLDLGTAAGLTPFEAAAVLDHLAAAGVLDIDPGDGHPWPAPTPPEPTPSADPPLQPTDGPPLAEVEPTEPTPSEPGLTSAPVEPGLSGAELPTTRQPALAEATAAEPALNETERPATPEPAVTEARRPAIPQPELSGGPGAGDAFADAWSALREVTGATDLAPPAGGDGVPEEQDDEPDAPPLPEPPEPDLVGRSDVDPGSLLRELASLSMGDEEERGPAEERAEPRPAPVPEAEPEREGRQRPGGRFGFRRGQRQ